MSKLQDDLAAEIAPWGSIAASIDALLISLARRIDECRCDPVKLSDLATVLREDSARVTEAVLAKPTPVISEQAAPELSAVLESAVSAALEA